MPPQHRGRPHALLLLGSRGGRQAAGTALMVATLRATGSRVDRAPKPKPESSCMARARPRSAHLSLLDSLQFRNLLFYLLQFALQHLIFTLFFVDRRLRLLEMGLEHIGGPLVICHMLIHELLELGDRALQVSSLVLPGLHLFFSLRLHPTHSLPDGLVLLILGALRGFILILESNQEHVH